MHSARLSESLVVRSRSWLGLLLFACYFCNGVGLRQERLQGPFLAATSPAARGGDLFTHSSGGWNDIKAHFRDIPFGSDIKEAVDFLGYPGILLVVFASFSGVVALIFAFQIWESNRQSAPKPQKESAPPTFAKRDSCLAISAASVIFVVSLFFLLAWFFGGIFLKQCIEHFDVAFLGTQVRLETLDIFPFSGTVSATGLTLYNPPGWTSKYLLHVDSISVTMSMLSVIFSFGQRVDVNELLTTGMHVIYEKSLLSSNIKVFLDHLKDLYGSGPRSDKGKGMEVSLHKVEIANVTASVEIPGAISVDVAVPNIIDNNFGKTVNSTSGTAQFIVDFLLDLVLTNVMHDAH